MQLWASILKAFTNICLIAILISAKLWSRQSISRNIRLFFAHSPCISWATFLCQNSYNNLNFLLACNIDYTFNEPFDPHAVLSAFGGPKEFRGSAKYVTKKLNQDELRFAILHVNFPQTHPFHSVKEWVWFRARKAFCKCMTMHQTIVGISGFLHLDK
jgi:hypothetical protein